MTALGPSMQKSQFNYRRTSCSHAEELMKKRAHNTK
jgi:hypothetical protein